MATNRIKFLPILLMVVHFFPPTSICVLDIIKWQELFHLVGVKIPPKSSVKQANAWIPAKYWSILQTRPNGEILINKPAGSHPEGGNFVFEFLSNLDHLLLLEVRLVNVKGDEPMSFDKCSKQLRHAMGKDCAIVAHMARFNKWIVNCGTSDNKTPAPNPNDGQSSYFLLEHRVSDRKQVVRMNAHTATTKGSIYARVHVKFLPEADWRPAHCTFALVFNSQANRENHPINYHILMPRKDVPDKWREELFDPDLKTTTTRRPPPTTKRTTTPTTSPTKTTTLTTSSPPKKEKTRYTLPPPGKHIAGFMTGM